MNTTTRRWFLTTTLFLLTGGAAFAGGGAFARQNGERKIDFEPLARQFIAEQGLDPENLGVVLFQEVLDGPAFCFLQAGAFDIRMPSSHVADKVHSKAFKEAVIALLELQGHWMAWYLRDAEGYEQANEDLETLLKWTKGWSAGAMKKAASHGGNLLERIKPRDEVTEAAQRLRAFAGPAEDQRFELGDDVGTILLAPTRKFFLETVAFLGWIDLDRRDFYWSDSTVGRTATWYDWTNIVPLEAAAWPVDYEKPFKPQSLNERHKTGLAQFVADRGGASLLRASFYRADFGVFESALRTNLVIASVGQNDLYLSDWGLSFGRTGASRQGTSQFIPVTGLPGKTSAGPSQPRGTMSFSGKQVPRWRGDAGADNFKKALAKGQKDGAGLAAKKKSGLNWKDKLANFELSSSKSNDKGLASAPFFGDAAARKDPPAEEFKNDFEEFARAYRSCFFHWMREHGTEENPAEVFAGLMQAWADPFGEVTFSDMVQKAYGIPLSGENDETDSMEWRFLKWLSK